MPFIQTVADDLPYIDPAPSSTDLAAAHELILSNLDQSTTQHPSLPALKPTNLTSTLTTHLTHLSTLPQPPKSILTSTDPGLDLTRYTTPTSTSTDHSTLISYLAQSRTNLTHLHQRHTTLSLLETHGRNAWLISNSNLEDELRSLERELVAARAEAEEVETERRVVQEAGKAEVEGLSEGWRKGVRRLVEVLVEGEKVQVEGREVRRGMGKT